MKENAEKFRALDPAELDKQLREGAEQMFRLRFQMSMGQMDGLKKLRSLRKERARHHLREPKARQRRCRDSCLYLQSLIEARNCCNAPGCAAQFEDKHPAWIRHLDPSHNRCRRNAKTSPRLDAVLSEIPLSHSSADRKREAASMNAADQC